MNWVDFVTAIYRLRDPEQLRVRLSDRQDPLPPDHPIRVMLAVAARRDAAKLNSFFAGSAPSCPQWVQRISPSMSWAECASAASVSISKLLHGEAAHRAGRRSEHHQCLLDALSTSWLGQPLSQVVPHLAITIDTESRGNFVRELAGTTLDEGAIDFMSKAGNVPNNLQGPYAVEAKVRRELAYAAEWWPLMVFHKADHDLSVLSRTTSWSPPVYARLWDTMIVGALLQPWKTSHALPGHTGTAAGDAAATLRLFMEQLQSLGDHGEAVLREWLACPSWAVSIATLCDQIIRYPLVGGEDPDCLGKIVPFAELCQATHWLWTRPASPSVTRLESGPKAASECRRIDPARAKAFIVDHLKRTDGEERSLILAAQSLFLRAEREHRGLFVAMLPEVLRRHQVVENALRAAEVPSDDSGLVVAVGRGCLYATSDPDEEQRLIKHVLGTSDEHDLVLDVTRRAVADEGVPVFGVPGSNELVDIDGALHLKEVRPWRKQLQTVLFRQVTTIKPPDGRLNAVVCNWFDEKGDPVGLADALTGRRWAYWRDVATGLHSLRVAYPNNAFVVVTRENEELAAVKEFLAHKAVALVNAQPFRSRLRHLEAIVDGRETRPVIMATPDDAPAWGGAARFLEPERFRRIRFVFLELPIEHWCEWTPHRVLPARELKRALKATLGPWCRSSCGMSSEVDELPASIVFDARVGTLMPEIPRQPVQLRRRTDEAYMEAEAQLAQPLGCTREIAAPAPRSLKAAVRFLQRHWTDKKEFRRPVQEDAVRAIIETADDLIVSLPTGGGKSLIFQAPALAMSESTLRLNLVLSPLRALMDDQVKSIPASLQDRVTLLTGDLDGGQAATRLAGIQDGRYQMVYIAPERLRTERFQRALLARAARDGGLGLIVFDEAHCITSWGHDFRPDYLKALSWINRHLRTGSAKDCNRLVCLSATMTGLVIDQLKRQLAEGLADADSRRVNVLPAVPGNPLPEHVRLEPIPAARIEAGENGRASRYNSCFDLLGRDGVLDNGVSSAIVFTRRRQDAEDLAGEMQDSPNHWKVKAFHAGMHKHDRAEVYEDFKCRHTQVLCATCAFGMGMDIRHIHRSIHLQPPSTLETLVQEAGRAGRDEDTRDKAALPDGCCTAFVLHDADDLSDYRTQAGMMRDFQVTPKLVAQVWSKLVTSSLKRGPLPSTWVAIIPEGEPLPGPDEAPDADHRTAKRRPNPNVLRLALHWLERCGRIDLEPGCASLLELSNVDPSRLSASGLSDDAQAVASVIRDLYSVASSPQASAASSGRSEAASAAAGRGLSWLLRTALGFLFGAEPAPKSVERPTVLAAARFGSQDNMILNVGDLCRRLGDKVAMPSRVLRAVADLEMNGAFCVARTLKAQPGRIAEGQDLQRWATDRLAEAFRLARIALEVHSARNRDEWESWIEAEVQKIHPIAKPLEVIELNAMSVEVQKERKRLHADLSRRQNTARRALGRALKAILLDPDDGVLQRPSRRNVNGADLEASRPPTLRRRYGLKTAARLEQASTDALSVLLSLGNSNHASDVDRSQVKPPVVAVKLSDLLKRCAQSARRLDGALRVINATGAWRVERAFVPSCHVMTIIRREPAEIVLPDPGIDEKNGGSTEAGADAPLRELQEQGRLRELQLAALHLLLRVPDPDERTSVLLQYFAASSLRELETVIEKAVAADLALGTDFELAAVVAAKRKQLFDQAYGLKVGNEKKAIIEEPPEKCLLVNAGPGSGKTTLLLWRAAFQLYSSRIAKAQSIVLLAFNRAIVAELRRRVQDELRSLGFGDLGQRIQCMTFDGLVARGLARAEHGVLERSKYDERRMRFVARCEADPTLLIETLGHPRLLMVDEAQDMRPPLDKLLKMIKEKIHGVGITCVGDDDQDIYEADGVYDGACMMMDLRNRLRMDEHFLLENFRSTTEIVERTQQYIQKAADSSKVTRIKAQQSLRSTRGEGSAWCKVERCLTHGEFVARARNALHELGQRQTVALLVRTNAEVLWWEQWAREMDTLSRGVKPILRADQLGIGETRRWHQWLLQLDTIPDDERLDEACFDHLLKAYQREVPEEVDGEAVEHLRAMRVLLARERPLVRVRDWKRAICEYKCGEWERVRVATMAAVTKDGAQPLVISTVYQAKGLEYDLVLIPPPLFNQRIRGMLPHRLLYVAATRAKCRLVISNVQSPPSDTPRSGTSLVLRGVPNEMLISSFGQSPSRRGAVNKIPIGATCECVPTVKGDKLWIKWNGQGLGLTATQTTGRRHSGRIVDVLVGEYDRGKLGNDDVEGEYPGWHYYPVITSLRS